MANINELLERAASLRDETALNSISPERAGGIMYDTLIALNELWLQQGAALLISKIYASVAAMEADTAPVSDLTGQPLRPGQIVVIASSDSDNGTVYRYNGTESPSWTAVGKIGNLEPVDSLDSDSTSLPLAAHQGKVLDGKISQLGQVTIPLGGILPITGDALTGTIISSGNDKYIQSSGDGAIFVDVEKFRGCTVKVTPNSTWNRYQIAFLRSKNSVASSYADYSCCAYGLKNETAANEYVIPFDCKYIYARNISTSYPDIDISPAIELSNSYADIPLWVAIEQKHYIWDLAKMLKWFIVGSYNTSLKWFYNGNTQLAVVISNVKKGTGFKYHIPEGYRVRFGNPEGTTSGWIEATDGDVEGYYIVPNDYVSYIIDYTYLTSGPEITEAALQNLVISYRDNVLEELISGQSAYLKQEQLLQATLTEFPVNWQPGVVNDINGLITPARGRLSAIIDVSQYQNLKLLFQSSTFRFYGRGWDGQTPVPSHATTTTWQYFNGEYTMPEGYKYLILSVDKGNIDVNDADIRGTKVFIDTNVSKLSKDVYNLNPGIEFPYKGEKIDVTHKFNINGYKALPDWKNMQGGAIYGDYLVCCMATDELTNPSANGFIYNIRTGEKLYDLLFGSTLGAKTYYMPHANQVSFGSEFYDANSDFPLLYVSQVNGGSGYNDIRGERGVLVYNLQRVLDGNNEITGYAPVLVQAIIPDLTDTALMDKLGKYTPNYIVDTENNRLIEIGYPNASWFDMNGPQPIAVFDLPSLADGTEIVLTNSDVIDNFTLPVSIAPQQSFYYNGKIYQCCGTTVPMLRVIDMTKKQAVTTINISSWSNKEAQFLGLYGERVLYYQAGVFTSGDDSFGLVYEFIFD